MGFESGQQSLSQSGSAHSANSTVVLETVTTGSVTSKVHNPSLFTACFRLSSLGFFSQPAGDVGITTPRCQMGRLRFKEMISQLTQRRSCDLNLESTAPPQSEPLPFPELVPTGLYSLKQCGLATQRLV